MNGQLVRGEGDKRVLLTPEFEDDDKAEKFQLRTVWNDNGRENQREADVEVASGEGIAVNFTKPIDQQKPWIALYKPRYDDAEEGDEPGQGEASNREQVAGQSEEPVQERAPETAQSAFRNGSRNVPRSGWSGRASRGRRRTKRTERQRS